MVNMNYVVAVLFFVATALAVRYDHPLPKHLDTILSTPGKQYQLYVESTQTIKLSDDDETDTFIGLNTHDPKVEVIDQQDLSLFYWHSELEFAINKFINFIKDDDDDASKKNKGIEKDDFKNDLESKPVRVALIECHYLLSKGLKQSCLADQLLTYASLVLDKDDIKSFFKHLGAGKKDIITKEKVEQIRHKKNKDPAGTAEELGAYYGDEGVSLEEFTDYVVQESVNDDFRRCREGDPNVETGDVKYKNDCLLEELVEYTNDDLTEIDIAVLYRAIDVDGKDGITKKEIEELSAVNKKPNKAKLVDRIMELLDMSLTTPKGSEPKIDYGEFRTYMRSPTVLLQAERTCTEPLDKQKEELECLFNLFIKLVTTNHDAIWLVVPDLEQQIAFEIFDDGNDGEIKKTELKFTNAAAKDKFFEEMDHDVSDYVCLEEWNEYMDIPHMVYGIGDCLLEERDREGRGSCYTREVEDIIDNIRNLKRDFFKEWFRWYDTNSDGIIAPEDNNHLEDKCGSTDLQNLFLDELGMGDRTVTEFEFKWYVKQQEISDRYDEIINAAPNKKRLDKSKFNAALMFYLENDITEYDIQLFFDELDGDDNHEIDAKDFDPAIWEKVKALIAKIDGIAPHGDADETVNYREFWLWLNSKKDSSGKGKILVKDYFETKCTKEIKGADQQEKEIQCYVDHFKDHNAEIYNCNH